MQTKEQIRAKTIFVFIEDAEKSPRKEAYGRLCLRLPFLIRANGLCQTLAFLESKASEKKTEFKQLIADLAKVSCGKPGNEYGSLARSADSQDYLQMTREALACAQWFKRYAEGVLKVNVVDAANSDEDAG